MDDKPTTPNNTQSAAAWFDSVPATASTPPPTSHRKLLLLIVTGVILVTGIVVAFLLTRPKSCFVASNYRDLVTLVGPVSEDATPLDTDIVQDEPLYVHPIYFTTTGTQFDLDAADDPTVFLQSIGSYSKTHQTSAPVSLKVNGMYTSADSKSLVEARVNHVRDIIAQSAGSTPPLIEATSALKIPDTDEPSDEEDFANGQQIFVTITPISRCAN